MQSSFPLDACSGIQAAGLVPERLYSFQQGMIGKQLISVNVLCRKHLRHVMGAGVTEVEARWLPEVAQPLIRLSGPLNDPTPHYSAAADAVVATHEATFGQHEWPMPAQELPCTDAAVQARHFAAALLDGSVLPLMAGNASFCGV